MTFLPGPKGLSAPYYMVVFSSCRSAGDEEAYHEMAVKMTDLAQEMDGYLGVESLRGADGYGITISYWRDEEAIKAWKRHADHIVAQRNGRRSWYDEYLVRIARVERDYHFVNQ